MALSTGQPTLGHTMVHHVITAWEAVETNAMDQIHIHCQKQVQKLQFVEGTTEMIRRLVYKFMTLSLGLGSSLNIL